MGEQPASYPVFRAARYIGCLPWELMEREDGRWWMAEALATERNEMLGNEARRKLQGYGGPLQA